MRVFADRLFQLLLSEIDAPDTHFYQDMSISAVHRVSLAKSIAKKYLESDRTTPEQDAACLQKFLHCNELCRTFKLEPKRMFEDVVINQVKMYLDSVFFNGPDLTLDLNEIFVGAGVGPGASIGTEEDCFYTKLFDSNLSSTSLSLNRLYRSSIAHHRTWAEAEKQRRLVHGDTIVAGSRLSFVPKTSDISRSICTEPVLNMFFQKGIGSFLEGVLKRRYSIDLSTQPDINRKLAKQGSIDGSFATIDLSSASDCISLDLVRNLFPNYFVNWLMRCRSSRTILPDGTEVELHMVSSMGNGFTFPLQTLIFAVLVDACYAVMGLPIREPDGTLRFGVFGDDIIVEKSAYDFVCQMLNCFGFTVNDDKSFNSGCFRESCGHDYYAGTDVRGVYIRKLQNDADVYSAFNRLARWSARTGVPLELTLSYLFSRVRRKLFVPYDEGDDAGFKVPRSVALPKFQNLKTRSDGYLALVTRSRNIRFPDSETAEADSKPYRRFNYNGDGLLISFVAGYIRDRSSSVRSNAKSFKVRVRYTPNWDFLPRADRRLFVGDGGWEATISRVMILNHNPGT